MRFGLRSLCRLSIPAVATLLLAVGCGDGGATPHQAGDDLTVVASFYPLAEAVRQVGGDAVSVTDLTPAGTEPHDLELAADDVDAVLDADLVVYLGRGFQPSVEAAVERRDGTSLELLAGLPVVEGAAEDLEAEEGSSDDAPHDEAAVDPHFWLDPTLFSSAVDEVEAALRELAPDRASTFQDGAAAYQEQLSGLDTDMTEVLQRCRRKDLVTSHAAFYYLASRYGLRQEAITGLSPEAEPDPGRLDELTDLIAARGVTTVFSETLVSPRVARALAREAGVETAVLNPIEGLSDDERAEGADYISVMRENLRQLRQGLQCG